MTPILLKDQYVFTCLKPSELVKLSKLNPMGTFQEKEGLTAILLKQQADGSAIQYSGVFKCITLSVHSSLEAVGLTAAVSSKLAEHNISANVVAAYYHDHIFVGEGDADQAMKALLELSQQGV